MIALIVVCLLAAALGGVLGVAISTPCVLDGYATHSVAVDSNN